MIQEWKKIGVEAENRPLETATWFSDGRDTGNFELMVDPHADFMDEPDLTLIDFVSTSSTTCTSGRGGRSTRPSARSS